MDLNKLMNKKDSIVKKLTSGIKFLFKKNNIKLYNGVGSFEDKNTILVKSDGKDEHISSKYIIIATGSSSLEIPSIKIDEKLILTSTGALSLKEVPKNMLVVGGGYIGLEMGSVWSRLGSKVTVVESLDRIVPNMDIEISNYFIKSLQKQGIEFKLGNKILSCKKNEKDVDVVIESLGEKKQINEKYNTILISVGRKPNTQHLDLERIGVPLNDDKTIKVGKNFQTKFKNIYAIGDVIQGPMLAHKAEEEGIVCAEIINGQKPSIDYNHIPAIIYTNPEVASVGQTEEQLKDKNIQYKSGKFPFSANGRALANSELEGFVKILADTKTDKILGAHIIGKDAGSLIAEVVTVMDFGGSSEDIARICHAHPTTGEAVKEAALNIYNRSIHI